MADAKIVDIKGVQWELKDEVARNKIAELENMYKDYGDIGINNAQVLCVKNGNMLLLQGQITLSMELHKSYKVADIPKGLIKRRKKVTGTIFDWETGDLVGMVYLLDYNDSINLFFSSGDVGVSKIYTFQLACLQ